VREEPAQGCLFLRASNAKLGPRRARQKSTEFAKKKESATKPGQIQKKPKYDQETWRFLSASIPTYDFFPTSRLLAVARSIHTLFGMHVPFVETLELILLVAEKGPVHSPIRRHDFFSRPTAAGSRQVVYQAGKTIALCKFTELRQWQHAKSRLKP
jgi:hypothetical protein